MRGKKTKKERKGKNPILLFERERERNYNCKTFFFFPLMLLSFFSTSMAVYEKGGPVVLIGPLSEEGDLTTTLVWALDRDMRTVWRLSLSVHLLVFFFSSF